MKRFLLGTAMMLGLALGIVHPQSAKAAETVTCTTYPGSNLGNRFKVCDGTASPGYDTGDANAIVQAFEDLPTSATNASGNLIKNSMTSLYANGDADGDGKGIDGVVYLFYSPTQYSEWATANGLTVVATNSAGAVTVRDAITAQAYYTIIWKFPAKTGWNEGDGTGGLQNLTNEMVHEFGHWTDYLDRALNTEDNKALVFSGISGLLSKAYAQDLTALDAAAVYPCSPPNENGGVFAGRADSFVTAGSTNAPYYICNGRPLMGTTPVTGTASTGNGPGLNASSNTKIHPNYVGLSNKAVLETAFQYFFSPGFVSSQTPYAELFAEAYANGIASGANYTNANYDAYFGTINNWSGLFCTAKLVQYIGQNGTLPTASNSPYNVNGLPNPNNCPFN